MRKRDPRTRKIPSDESDSGKSGPIGLWKAVLPVGRGIARLSSGKEFLARHRWIFPLLIASFFAMWSAREISPPSGGPGITCDELYHVFHAKRVWSALIFQGWEFFHPRRIRENFPYGEAGAPPFHPPLGYYLIGAVHWLFDPYPSDALAVSIVAGRFAGSLLFFVLICVVGLWLTARAGPVAGISGAWACGAMPRLFGHAHLAGLDLLTALTSVAAICAAVDAELPTQSGASRESNRPRRTLWAGFCLGLAMLTRLHGILLSLPMALWFVWVSGWRGLMRASVCVGTAFFVFFLGWPWLWLDPFDHLGQYLHSSASRLPLRVYYLGSVWQDVAVPWHYPFVITFATIPAGFLLLGLVGVGALCRQMFYQLVNSPRGCLLAVRSLAAYYEWMVLLQLSFWLMLFAVPGIPVYDGERLFLTVYPLWAMLVGWGTKFVFENRQAFAWAGRPLFLGVVLILGSGIAGHFVYRPAYLSFYNSLVGGIKGAFRLGLEVNYWGDSITHRVLEEACRWHRRTASREDGPSYLLFAPNLASFHAAGLNVTFRPIDTCGAEIVGWEASWSSPPPKTKLAILYHRRAELEALPAWLRDAPIVYEYSLRGIWLARVVLLPDQVSNVHGKHLPVRISIPREKS